MIFLVTAFNTFFEISFSPTVAAYTYMNYVTISFPWYDVIRVLFEPCSVPIMIVVWQEVRINKNVISRSHSKAMSADHYIPEIVIFGTDEHNWNKCKNIVLIKVDWYSEHKCTSCFRIWKISKNVYLLLYISYKDWMIFR